MTVFKKILLFVLSVSIIIPFALYIIYDKEVKVLNESTRKEAPGKFINLSKGLVHYELQGPLESPVIVLIPGAGSGYYAWDKNYSYLVSKGYRVLRYDLYGRGYSDRPEVIYSLDLFTSQLLELLDSLKISQPVNLAGLSMGAMVALDLTDRYPQRVNKLLLIDPAAINKGEKSWTLKTPILSDFLMTVYWAPKAVDKQMLEFYNPGKVSDYKEKLGIHLQYEGLTRAMRSTWLNTLSINMEPALYRIAKNAPLKSMLLWGEKDPLTPIAWSKTYLSAIPSMKFAEIKNAGHVSNYERPDLVNPILNDFFKK